ncbi:hypothetical protein VNO77_04426 [Canavalia gladiata]|uniref:Uncharacterized protein n=1 Tax=Canavalia gladiata TaxID=3824 RepID=A0AAN9R7R3_CANGL
MAQIWLDEPSSRKFNGVIGIFYSNQGMLLRTQRLPEHMHISYACILENGNFFGTQFLSELFPTFSLHLKVSAFEINVYPGDQK